MQKIKAFYPVGTERIIHRDKTGNIYKLDAIDQPIRIKEILENDPRFEIVNVSSKDDSVLLYTHSDNLINSYKSGSPIELSESSGLLWHADFYPWVINKAWATIEASKDTIKHNKSLVITSGGHHAEFEHGRGFGPISNMVIAAKELLIKKLVGRIAILDLDGHYANGTHSQVVNEKRILSCDIWKYKLPYWKYTPNSENIFHKQVSDKSDYFKALDLTYKRIRNFNPDLLFVYNGLDPLSNDRMGGVIGFDESTLFERNDGVAKFISENNLPVCVFIGGGYIDYSKSSTEIYKNKKHLTELFVKSTASIFGLLY